MVKERLDDYGSNTYSQFGEDGCIEHIFGLIGVQSKVAVEFGAGNGLSCSNTAHLWRDQGWTGFLVEPDPARFGELDSNAAGYNTICRRVFLTPEGPTSIAAILAEHAITEVDYLSIDVDGDDFQIFDALACSPRVISIEFNPTIPPHLNIRQSDLGAFFGASLTAIVRLGQEKGYRFVGATYCNAFFVDEIEAAPFDGYEVDANVLMPPNRYTYAITDFTGRITLAGQPLPWGAQEPFVLPLESNVYVTPITSDVQYLRRGFERVWGPAKWLEVPGLSRTQLQSVLKEQHPLVCLNISGGSLAPEDWIWLGTTAPEYRVITHGGIVALIRRT